MHIWLLTNRKREVISTKLSSLFISPLSCCSSYLTYTLQCKILSLYPQGCCKVLFSPPSSQKKVESGGTPRPAKGRQPLGTPLFLILQQPCLYPYSWKPKRLEILHPHKMLHATQSQHHPCR